MKCNVAVQAIAVRLMKVILTVFIFAFVRRVDAWHGDGLLSKNIKMLKQLWTTVNALAFAGWQASHEQIR
jgi:hypothetical protein